MRSVCVGLIRRSSAFVGREGECRYLFNLVCARPFGLGPCILDAPIGQILWRARVEKVGRHFRHAFQVRDAPLRRNSYDWGNAYGISVRCFLWYNFDHLAWVAPVDGQLALVAPWPRSAIRLEKC